MTGTLFTALSYSLTTLRSWFLHLCLCPLKETRLQGCPWPVWGFHSTRAPSREKGSPAAWDQLPSSEADEGLLPVLFTGEKSLSLNSTKEAGAQHRLANIA